MLFIRVCFVGVVCAPELLLGLLCLFVVDSCILSAELLGDLIVVIWIGRWGFCGGISVTSFVLFLFVLFGVCLTWLRAYLGIYYLLNAGLGLIVLCWTLLFSDYYLFIGCRLYFVTYSGYFWMLIV